jgi:hypothetical protein
VVDFHGKMFRENGASHHLTELHIVESKSMEIFVKILSAHIELMKAG